MRSFETGEYSEEEVKERCLFVWVMRLRRGLSLLPVPKRRICEKIR
jgi:hypothetical protein